MVCPRVRVQRDAVRGTLPATEVCWPLPGPAQRGGSLLFSSPSCQTQLCGKSCTWQQSKQRVRPKLTETRSCLCRGHSILCLTGDTSSHYCPRKVLAHLLYNAWGMFSPSLLILFMSHCWDIVPELK